MKKISRVTVETTFDPLTVLDDKSILVSIHLLYDRNIFGTEELRISMAGVSRFETRPSRVVRFRFTRFKQFRACKHFCPPLSNFLRLNCCFLSLSLSLSLFLSPSVQLFNYLFTLEQFPVGMRVWDPRQVGIAPIKSKRCVASRKKPMEKVSFERF